MKYRGSNDLYPGKNLQFQFSSDCLSTESIVYRPRIESRRDSNICEQFAGAKTGQPPPQCRESPGKCIYLASRLAFPRIIRDEIHFFAIDEISIDNSLREK